ncbi:hypothetical protein UFOVP223_18 [uncultured Caudovirales phage]|uniref:Uncharacterized protein n=1 Tax=uncultured Caudovirales phage TaxID=2100421 RepID=A0A6J5L4B9_9CAUD|nr:hypothetical protein UFOVP110_12 [uncultured Caudovirales phage]CAB5219009.1 hypothetical protein UFOVP223_18 [uncultured Caudovirales phage]
MPELNGDQLGLYANREGEAMSGGAPFLPNKAVGERVTRTRRGPLTLPTYDPQPGNDAPPTVAKKPGEGATETVDIAPENRPFQGIPGGIETHTGRPSTRAPQTEREAKLAIAAEKGQRIAEAGRRMQKMAEATLFRGQPGLAGMVSAGALPPATLDLYRSAQDSAYNSGMKLQTEVEYPKAELERKIQDRNAARSAAWAEERKGIVLNGLADLAKNGGATRVKSAQEREMGGGSDRQLLGTMSSISPTEYPFVHAFARQAATGTGPTDEEQDAINTASYEHPERLAVLQDRAAQGHYTYHPEYIHDGVTPDPLTGEVKVAETVRPEVTKMNPGRNWFDPQTPAGTPGQGRGNAADTAVRQRQQSGVFHLSEVMNTAVGNHITKMPEFQEALATGNSMKVGNFIVHMDMSKDEFDKLPQSGVTTKAEVDPRQQMADEGYMNEFHARVADAQAKADEKNALVTSLQQKNSADLAAQGGGIGDVNWTPKEAAPGVLESQLTEGSKKAAENWAKTHGAPGHLCETCDPPTTLEVDRRRWEGRTPSNTSMKITGTRSEVARIQRTRQLETMSRLWASDPDFYHHLLAEPGVGQHIEDNQNEPWAKAGLSKLRRNVKTTKTPPALIPFKAATATKFARNRKGGKGKILQKGNKGNLYPVQTEEDTIVGRNKPAAE